MDLNMMSNAELKIKLKELEFEYEALQNKVKNDVERMGQLDKKYIQIAEILQKRTKGII
jgi:hypothetical protein